MPIIPLLELIFDQNRLTRHPLTAHYGLYALDGIQLPRSYWGSHQTLSDGIAEYERFVIQASVAPPGTKLQGFGHRHGEKTH